MTYSNSDCRLKAKANISAAKLKRILDAFHRQTAQKCRPLNAPNKSTNPTSSLNPSNRRPNP